jgi:hypothetical protein
MASTVQRVFSQNANPAAATITRFYAAPTTGFTVLSQLTVHNNGVAGDFRIYVGDFNQTNATAATKRYGPPAASVPAGTTVVVPGRIVVHNGGWIDVYGSHANFNFAMDAVETTVTA